MGDFFPVNDIKTFERVLYGIYRICAICSNIYVLVYLLLLEKDLVVFDSCFELYVKNWSSRKSPNVL